VIGTTMGSPREYRALLAHVEQASWSPAIDSVYPLEQIDVAARRLTSSERFGKVVLSIT
jgi:NADPH:quinone reductase-like Zn-dependent oxidoreductase